MTAPVVPPDVAVAQTAAAVENVLIAVYGRLASSSMSGAGLGPFIARTVAQHSDHLAAFNAAAVRLGGKAQTGVDQPLMTSVVQPGLAAIASGLDAVMFSAELEMIAAATYTAQVAAVADHRLRASLASVAGVECQHQGVLLAVASVLEAGAAAIDGFPLAARQLAPTLEGPPVAFVRTDQGRPPTEGVAR
ncbi:MAG TPA: ferritin-like domain-containing protein [Acidimicrobiales bacterium]|nr:ferritin-like domain-containing protein [Acidimicrobiales bacterium]